MGCTGASWSVGVNNPVRGAVPVQRRGEGESLGPPCERGYEGGFATALMLKDMGLARRCASNAGVRLPLGEHAERIYERVIADDPTSARKDFSIVYRYLERVAAGEVSLNEPLDGEGVGAETRTS